MNKIPYGTWLKQERERRGLSQADLGKVAGLSQKIISLIEMGYNDPAPSSARRLWKALQYAPIVIPEHVCLPSENNISIPEVEEKVEVGA